MTSLDVSTIKDQYEIFAHDIWSRNPQPTALEINIDPFKTLRFSNC